MTPGLARAEQIYQNRNQKAKELKTEGKKIIGYLCSFTPVEMITAADLVPYRITGSLRPLPAPLPVAASISHLKGVTISSMVSLCPTHATISSIYMISGHIISNMPMLTS